MDATTPAASATAMIANDNGVALLLRQPVGEQARREDARDDLAADRTADRAHDRVHAGGDAGLIGPDGFDDEVCHRCEREPDPDSEKQRGEIDLPVLGVRERRA